MVLYVKVASVTGAACKIQKKISSSDLYLPFAKKKKKAGITFDSAEITSWGNLV